MTDMWINLSSKDLNKSRVFFEQLGFEMNDRHSGSHMQSFFLTEKKIVICLFPESTFSEFIGHSVTDTSKSNEFLISLGASSPSEVNEIAIKAERAGATLYAKPGYKDGWMYGCGFVDLDGHRWNILYMDMAKMPKC